MTKNNDLECPLLWMPHRIFLWLLWNSGESLELCIKFHIWTEHNQQQQQCHQWNVQFAVSICQCSVCNVQLAVCILQCAFFSVYKALAMYLVLCSVLHVVCPLKSRSCEVEVQRAEPVGERPPRREELGAGSCWAERNDTTSKTLDQGIRTLVIVTVKSVTT